MSARISALVRPRIASLSPYSSARDDFTGTAHVFLDANENALGSVGSTLCNRYPDPHQRKLKATLGTLRGISPERIFFGNGSDEVIDLLFRVFCEPEKDQVLLTPPTYGMYSVAAAINAVSVVEVPLTGTFQLDLDGLKRAANPRSKLLILCSPNNPTANLLHRDSIVDVLSWFPGIVAVDEAYGDFAPEGSVVPLLEEFEQLVVIQTFSKAWGLAGARAGVAFAHEFIVSTLDKVKPPYNMNSLTQELLLTALDNVAKKDLFVRELLAERERLAKELAHLPFVRRVYPSDANFLLVETTDPKAIYSTLLEAGIVVRDRSNLTGLGGCLRITVGTPDENSALLSALQRIAQEETQ
ncbi:MAG: histidinol-phosphate transaminase [Bdellovibrionales bacterium]|nr:histidinol-phosphate transaminase [Bdellovibrionales bacterium]